MTRDNTCNGWSNYATWRINLEICDDYIQSQVEDISHGHQDPYASVIDLAGELKAFVEQGLTGFGEISDETLAVQYAKAFIGQVDWYEIAKTHAENSDCLIAR